jgi:hypothetical protein
MESDDKDFSNPDNAVHPPLAILVGGMDMLCPVSTKIQDLKALWYSRDEDFEILPVTFVPSPVFVTAFLTQLLTHYTW